MPEVQTCPRRTGEFGPWDHGEGLDTWERDRWKATQEEGDAYVREFEERNPGGSAASPWWRGPAPMPRTCSFCGGVHPEDAIALVGEHGWEVAATGKAYKRYLEPPGSRTQHEALLRRMREHPGENPWNHGVPSVWSPTPPVKLYTMHLDEDQRKRAARSPGRSRWGSGVGTEGGAQLAKVRRLIRDNRTPILRMLERSILDQVNNPREIASLRQGPGGSSAEVVTRVRKSVDELPETDGGDRG